MNKQLTANELRELISNGLINTGEVVRISGVSRSTLDRFLNKVPVKGLVETKINSAFDELRALLCPNDERPVEIGVLEELKPLLSIQAQFACDFMVYVINNPKYQNIWEAFAGYTMEVINSKK